ncbi:hypothetical protein DZC75_04835 [Pseudomonas parafulva]|uniref:Uncharacterized protein n=1 Tax=Pseudomonas parafulva TaxID=157782 RepID=A0AAI8PA92_9PSED|nr:hypothetical protein DZC75_04835 [Pseudomonas parafulva]
MWHCRCGHRTSRHGNDWRGRFIRLVQRASDIKLRHCHLQSTGKFSIGQTLRGLAFPVSAEAVLLITLVVTGAVCQYHA